VDPDIEVKQPALHTVTTELIRQGIIFDFATRYRSKHESIPPARQFRVDDALYSEFAAYCKERDFKFDTRTEKEFAKLEGMMKEEHYDDDLANELLAIKNKLTKEKQEDVLTFKDEIRNLIRNEIVTRYYYKKGEIEASFEFDPDILAAVEVLKNTNEYKGLLNGTVARKVVGKEE
jgi:carboxyl-terminal processing protease